MDRVSFVCLLVLAAGCSAELVDSEIDLADRVVDHGDGTYHLELLAEAAPADVREHGVVWRYIGQRRFRHSVTPPEAIAERVADQPQLHGRQSALLVNTRFDEQGRRWLALDPDDPETQALLAADREGFRASPLGGTPVAVSRLCFEVETAWIGHPSSASDVGGGDFWRLNEPRPPIGARVYVERTWSVSVYNLDDDGCFSFATPPDPYTVTVESHGEVRGIDIQSYTDWYPFFDCPFDPFSPLVGPCSVEIVSNGNFRYASRTYAYDGPVIRTETLFAADESNSIAWHPYVLMAYAMTRSTMHLGDQGNTSGCGPADVPCCGHTEWADKSDHDDISPTTLISYTHVKGKGYASNWAEDGQVQDDGTRRAYGYGSMFTGGTSTNDSVVALGSGVRDKWPMAHELGHMLVMLRMGDRTETNYGAALYGCNGQFAGGDLTTPSDSGDSSEKSNLTREFSSGAAREGWANFYAAQLFNDVDESDCWIRSAHIKDFDLDGDLDNDYGPSYQRGVYSCETSGLDALLGEPDPTDPLAAWIGARDWLDQVWDNAPACGSASSASQIVGRSSIYDWTRYFWDMATDENVPVEALADIYVDMCPTNWVAGPGSVPNDNWPEHRLDRSAGFHGHGAAHDAQKNNGVDHI